MSKLFLRTLREDPSDAEVAGHRLLVRAGYIRREAPGIFAWLPLGLRVLRRVEAVVREEMDAAGAQEVHFPALLPREPYEATGRWDEYGDDLFKLQDRHAADYLLAPRTRRSSPPGQRHVLVVQGSAAEPVPDPDEVPR
jgi:prolyl-tRNA synthetase